MNYAEFLASDRFGKQDLLAFAHGKLLDGEPIYRLKRAKVGLFRDLSYRHHRNPSERPGGGRPQR